MTPVWPVLADGSACLESAIRHSCGWIIHRSDCVARPEGEPMTARDVILQIAQVLTTLLFAPLLQGVILQFEERVQRGQGPGVFQPYRDLWKLFHKQIVVPDTASWLYWAAPVVAFTTTLTVYRGHGTGSRRPGIFRKKARFRARRGANIRTAVVSTRCPLDQRDSRQTALAAIGPPQFLSRPDRTSVRSRPGADIGLGKNDPKQVFAFERMRRIGTFVPCGSPR